MDFQGRYGLTVHAGNVLGLRAVILEEAEELTKAVRAFRQEFPNGMPLLGGDPVSRDASVAFTERTEVFLAHGQAHIDHLKRLGAELAATARAYGHAEQTIADSFTPGRPLPPAGLTSAQELSGTAGPGPPGGPR